MSPAPSQLNPTLPACSKASDWCSVTSVELKWAYFSSRLFSWKIVPETGEDAGCYPSQYSSRLASMHCYYQGSARCICLLCLAMFLVHSPLSEDPLSPRLNCIEGSGHTIFYRLSFCTETRIWMEGFPAAPKWFRLMPILFLHFGDIQAAISS